MKSFSFLVLFAAAAINFLGTDLRTVEIAQAQQAERTMVVDDLSQAAPVLVAAR